MTCRRCCAHLSRKNSAWRSRSCPLGPCANCFLTFSYRYVRCWSLALRIIQNLKTLGSEGQSPLGLQGLFPIAALALQLQLPSYSCIGSILCSLTSLPAPPAGACLGALKDVAESQASCRCCFVLVSNTVVYTLSARRIRRAFAGSVQSTHAAGTHTRVPVHLCLCIMSCIFSPLAQADLDLLLQDFCEYCLIPFHRLTSDVLCMLLRRFARERRK